MQTALTPDDYQSELLGQVEDVHFRLQFAELHLQALTNRIALLLATGDLIGDVETAHLCADAIKFLREGSK